MNLKDKLHDVVYVGVNFGESLIGFEPITDQYANEIWIKQINGKHYLLTPEELLQLKKQWCSEAFDSGGFSRCNLSEGVHTDKTEYINNLKLD